MIKIIIIIIFFYFFFFFHFSWIRRISCYNLLYHSDITSPPYSWSSSSFFNLFWDDCLTSFWLFVKTLAFQSCCFPLSSPLYLLFYTNLKYLYTLLCLVFFCILFFSASSFQWLVFFYRLLWILVMLLFHSSIWALLYFYTVYSSFCFKTWLFHIVIPWYIVWFCVW